MKTLERLERINREYDGTVALSDISLQVKKGEILTIIGPNGAGKTSLLRIMALIDKPASGSVYYDGVEVTDANHDRIKGKITMVFQEAVLFSTTVHKNLAYGLKLRNCPKGEIERRIEEALELVRMKDYEYKPAKKLSGGERQRVVLARALALEPELLLLDEPTANLDSTSAAIIERIIRDIKEDTGVVLATHNLFQARRLSDKVACLLNGVLLDEGTPGRIFERPRNVKTSKFISGELF